MVTIEHEKIGRDLLARWFEENRILITNEGIIVTSRELQSGECITEGVSVDGRVTLCVRNVLHEVIPDIQVVFYDKEDFDEVSKVLILFASFLCVLPKT